MTTIISKVSRKVNEDNSIIDCFWCAAYVGRSYLERVFKKPDERDYEGNKKHQFCPHCEQVNQPYTEV